MSPSPPGVVTQDDPAEAARSRVDRLPTRASRGPDPIRSCVGVVVTDAPEGLLGDPYYRTVFRGISTALAERSLLFMLMAPLSAPELRATRKMLVGTQFDGLIMIGLHADSWLPRLIRQRKIPAVLCGSPPPEFGLCGVDCDNRAGSVLAVNHLLALGRRRIAHISGNLDVPCAMHRRTGYRDALTAAGIQIDPTLEEVGNFHQKPARLAMERLLHNHPDLDAVFVASDQMAVEAMDVLVRAGRRIPEDVAVIGFDDSTSAMATSPALSSVHQPIEESGRQAVHVLARHIEEPQEAPRQVVLRTRLVVRASTVGHDGPGLTGEPYQAVPSPIPS
jgi:DNA-binding LacI/PurR family transcriptional regulator